MIHAEAEAEVLSAVAYYEVRREGLGSEFRREFEAAVDRIRDAPQAFVLVDDRGMRKHQLRRFPIPFYYVELDQAIWIAAVAQQKRRPGYWADRSPEPGGDA